ncbi:MAG: 50S ribosomal protein L13 [Bacteroidetes bacterium]|nr:50S ribosomal protein L13 [Bacteroidota bacterium]
MDIQSYKTRSIKSTEVQRKWFVIDAEQAIVGRLATRVASILRGKHKPSFTPHVDTGDYVIIVNADKVRFTGNKEDAKLYYRYSGYPGGLKSRTVRVMREKKPEHLVRHAVKGMLPKGPLGRQMLKKLKVYATAEHPHEAQQPEKLSLHL